MAFTSRAIRQTGVFKTATPKEVGPGSYDFALSGKAEQVRGRAPFSSTAERQLTAGQPEHVTPGPGSYIEQSKPNASAQASSNTFVNRVKRFGPSAIEKEAVPGPGSYNRDVEWVKNGSGSRVGGQGGPATESSVVWFRNPSAPSIPTHAQSFGYEQGGDGRLVRQGAPPGGFSGAPNDAAGPGDYENTVSALTERTTSWAKSNVPRQFVKETKTPGPGHYAKPIDTMGEQPLEEEEPPVGLSSFTSKVSRGLADGQKTKKKNQSPGPGAYNPPSMFNSQQVPENLQFFGSTSRRGFEIEPSQYAAPGNWRTPGPGSYEEKRTSFVKGARRGKLAERSAAAGQAPFDTLQPRFRDSKTSAPGPGEYEDAEAKSMVTGLARKTRARNGVFGTTTNRFFGSQMHAEIAATGRNPGPGQYDIAGDGTTGAGSKATGRRRRPKQTSVFTSGTRRFAASAPAAVAGPAPGAYDVVPKWPGEEPARLTLLERDVFISNAQRFSSKNAAGGNQPGLTPGPGTYEADVVQAVDPRHMGIASLEGRGTTGTAKRFAAENPARQSLNVPGPGAYNASDPAAGLVKRSYNITIDM